MNDLLQATNLPGPAHLGVVARVELLEGMHRVIARLELEGGGETIVEVESSREFNVGDRVVLYGRVEPVAPSRSDSIPFLLRRVADLPLDEQRRLEALPGSRARPAG